MTDPWTAVAMCAAVTVFGLWIGFGISFRVVGR